MCVEISGSEGRSEAMARGEATSRGNSFQLFTSHLVKSHLSSAPTTSEKAGDGGDNSTACEAVRGERRRGVKRGVKREAKREASERDRDIVLCCHFSAHLEKELDELRSRGLVLSFIKIRLVGKYNRVVELLKRTAVQVRIVCQNLRVVEGKGWDYAVNGSSHSLTKLNGGI